MATAVPARGGLCIFYCKDSSEFDRVMEIILDLAVKIDHIDPEGSTFRLNMTDVESARTALAERSIELKIEPNPR